MFWPFTGHHQVYAVGVLYNYHNYLCCKSVIQLSQLFML